MILLFLRFVRSFIINAYAKCANFEPIAPEHVIKGRYRMCEGCDFYRDGNCQKCGCLVMAKVMLSTEKCPIGKWSRIWIKRT